jgi:HSP20 family molecular chaperone IbpA
MAAGQELQVQEKRELQKKEEPTIPVRVFVPTTDILEDEQSLTVVMEMPGVSKETMDINLQDRVLTVEGRIDLRKYDQLQPVYTEYNIGNFRRSFSLSNNIDQDKIRADMKDGVLTLTLPKAEEAKPRKIAVT